MENSKVRINITMDKRIRERMTNEADLLGMSVSGFITMCVNNYFMSRDSVSMVSELKQMMEQGIKGN